ncbi:MAG: dethiobiotin synthase [Chromatiales bacterium]|nr:dethiobiotin synthase [Chromatiales bacterium]
MRNLFVTGTDTGVGKTRVSVALLRAAVARGERAVGMKPVASGCRATPPGLRSEDAEALIAAGNVAAAYDDVNPYAFLPPTAPHLAAAAAGVSIDPGRIRAAYRRLAADAGRVVVEGVGGWLVPIGAHATMADVARALELPVVLVVGMRLGCINHALLTAQAVPRAGCRLAGWVANHVDPEVPEGYLEALQALLDAPLIGNFRRWHRRCRGGIRSRSRGARALESARRQAGQRNREARVVVA